MNISNVCILGTDKRMDYVAQKFYDMGYDVSRDMTDYDEKSIVILPPPVKSEMIKEVIPQLKQGTYVYGGAISKEFTDACLEKGIKVFDYLKWDRVTEANAKLTAKGILKEAEALKSIEPEDKCLVTGFGFCGKAIARELKQKADVTVMVRRKEVSEEIVSCGYSYINMAEKNDFAGEYKYIFNTVPSLVLDRDFLDKVSSDALIFDIASSPGGTDFMFCREKGIYAILSLGIPGRLYPKEAGEIIADGILNHITTI